MMSGPCGLKGRPLSLDVAPSARDAGVVRYNGWEIACALEPAVNWQIP